MELWRKIAKAIFFEWRSGTTRGSCRTVGWIGIRNVVWWDGWRVKFFGKIAMSDFRWIEKWHDMWGVPYGGMVTKGLAGENRR